MLLCSLISLWEQLINNGQQLRARTWHNYRTKTRGHKAHTTRKNYQLYLNLYDSAEHIVVKHPILCIWASDQKNTPKHT